MLIKNDRYEVLTPYGFCDFKGFNISRNKILEIKTSIKSITCTYGHLFDTPSGLIAAKDLTLGDFINSSNNISEILDIIHTETEEYVVDLINVQNKDNLYYTNELVSHNCLVLDEFAHISNFEEFYASVLPTISAGKNTKLILTTTPLGLNHGYKFWKDAKEGKNDFYTVFVPWNKVPGRDEEWKEHQLGLTGHNLEKFAQEYECEFLGSSGTLISGWKLKELVHQTPEVQKEGLLQYSQAQKNRVYMMVCDVSRGKGLDYSAFQLIDVTEMPYKQVCTYRNNNITPIDYAEVIFKVAKTYNNASVLVEINDIGEQVSHSLYYDFEYEYVLFTESAGRAGKRISAGFSGHNTDKGIRTTKQVKSVGCSMLKLLIEQNQLIVNDHETISELSTFSKKGNSYEAESGKNDDLVMGLVLFGWLSDQQYFKDLTNIETLHILRDKTEQDIEQDLSAFGFIADGTDIMEDYEIANGDAWMNVPIDYRG